MAALMSATLGLLALIEFISPGAQAAEWSAEGKLTNRFEADDNIRLTNQSHDSAVGGTVSPELKLGHRSARFDATIDSRFDFTKFWGDEGLDTNDQRVVGDTEYRTQLGVLEVNGEFRRNSTRTSEIEDTGRVFSNARRTSYKVGPTWTYALSQRDTIHTAGGYENTKYSTNQLTGYKQYYGSAGWTRSFSELGQVDFTGFFSRVETDSVSNLKSNTYGGQLTYAKAITQRLEVSAAAGMRHTATNFKTAPGPKRGIDTNGFVIDASATYRGEVSEATLSYSRSADPSGDGRLIEKDVVRLSGKYQALQLMWLEFTGTYQESDSADEIVKQFRRYYSVEPRLRWRVARDWDVTATYRRRTNKRRGAGGAANSNAVMVALIYRAPKWSISR